jgi:hypothetical protein
MYTEDQQYFIFFTYNCFKYVASLQFDAYTS